METDKAIKISVSEDFSRRPGPRYWRLGVNSGEEFRNNVLIPTLQKAKENHAKVIVNLDGTMGYGASFLEESFGGAVREGYHIDENTLELEAKRSRYLIKEIWGYIYNAQKSAVT